MEKIGKEEINNFLQNLKDVEEKINELKSQLKYYTDLQAEGLQLLENAKKQNPELFIHLYS